MDMKTFVVGIALVVFSICGYSQNVPDDVVYTEVKKTLVNGTTGILRCAFRGEPNAVYWKKGTGPTKSTSVILLSYGDMFGPRYEDGSCDIDEKYSLVFKQVTESDAGRYICRVSNYKGILIHNFTDVTISNTPVRTKDSVSVQKGTICVLPCRIDIRHRKVSWVKGSNDTLITVETSHHAFKRSGHLGGVFDITKDNSLVVNNVKILHDGSYTCQVTDYDTGHVFQNTTRVYVFAFPLEPFPSIKECPEGQQHISSCTLHIEAETILTCEVKKYYPDIDLYFRHGTTRIDSLETTVWNNTDGTRNKVITIATNGTTQTIFECVASGMVGEAEDRTVTVHLIRDGQQNLLIIAIVVPMILLLVVTSVVITVYVVKRRNKRKYDKVPTMVMVYNPQRHDLISYIELWKLVEFGTKEGIKDGKFEEALQSLMLEISPLTSGSKTCSRTPTDTNANYYDRFSDWKAKYIGNSQKEACLDACSKAGLNSVVGKLRDYSESTRAITLDDLEHTLWHSTANTENIIALLQELGVVHKPLEEWKDKEKCVIKNAMTLLMQWRDTNKPGNQEVMLSLALEAINYTRNEMDFFRIPDGQKSELNENEIKELLLPELGSPHCKVLIEAMENYDKTSWYRLAMKYFGSSKKKVWIENVIDQNMTHLFDIHQMIEDWLADQNCSNYEKRLRLQDAAESIENAGSDKLDPSNDNWLSTKKIEQIINLVPKHSMMKLCESLNINCREENFTEKEKLLNTVSTWRNDIPKQEHPKIIKKLSAGLQDISFGGLMSGKKGTSIYKAELVDLALDLIMDDLRPFTKALGISEMNFISYRKAFKPSHLELGTIRLVSMLVDMYPKVVFENKDVRVSVCSILDKAGYVNAMKRFDFAFEPSYGELCSLTTACKFGYTANAKEKKDAANERMLTPPPEDQVNDDKTVEIDSQEPHASISSPNLEEIGFDRKDKSVPQSEEAGVASKVDIKKKMQSTKTTCPLQELFELTDEDMQNIPDEREASKFKIFQIWKEKVCPGLIDHRIVLAEGLKKKAEGNIAASLINGKFQGRETSMDFIDDMLSKMGRKQEGSLLRLLQKKRDKKAYRRSETTQWIFDWVAGWTKEMESWTKKYVKGAVQIKQVDEKHRDFNDKLVENGFFDLAREIMIIEQGLEVDPVMESVLSRKTL